MENKQAFLLKAKSVRQTKTGEPRDLGIYTIAVYNDGGWEAMDFMMEGAQKADRFLGMLGQGPLRCLVDFKISKNFETGQARLALNSLDLAKQG